MLPNGYVLMNRLGGKNCYFNTNVLPSNTLNIKALFSTSIGTSGNVYYFGSRNTNSNTSAGQLNLLTGATAYLGYASARISLTDYISSNRLYLIKLSNEFDILNGATVFEKTGATTVFTGTRPMYILALNNAGSVNYGGGASDTKFGVVEFSIEQNGVEINHYVPVFDENNNRYGLYDLINDVLLENMGTGSFYETFTFNVEATEGGIAYINKYSLGTVDKMYYQYGINDVFDERLVAKAKEGYEFAYWEDSNGNIISKSRQFNYRFNIFVDTGAPDITVKAVFQKITNEVQNNNYMLLGLQYGVGEESLVDQKGNASDIYALVRSFQCEIDMRTQTTSTIELESIPSAYTIDMPVFLFSPKGAIVYVGIIKDIEGNTLTCREPISMYDTDILFKVDAERKTSDIRQGIFYYVMQPVYYGYGDTSSLIEPRSYALYKKMRPLYVDSSNALTDIRFGDQVYSTPTVDSAEISNVEDYLLKMSEEYGIVYEPNLYSYTNPLYVQNGAKHMLQIKVLNPSVYGSIHLGDNIEELTNINIVESNTGANYLLIYNDAGTSIRGAYATKNDGSITQISSWTGFTTDLLSYSNCVNTVVSSDDSIKSLVRENLGNAQLNHEITFTIDLTKGTYRFDDFMLGMKVVFYFRDRVYYSQLTSIDFEGENDIKSLNLKLGNVRMELTSKLNLGKV